MNAALFPDLIVNGEHVPHTVVAAETQNQEAPKGKPGIAWRKAANAVAIRTLLLQEAARRGLDATPQEVGPGRFETPEEARVRALLDLVVDGEAPTDADILAEWERDPTRFRAPPLWEVSHILCACDPRDTEGRDKAHARALALTAQAVANPQGFAALAARESDCDSRGNGGTLGQLGPGDTVPEFESALRRMEDGQITQTPVLTRHGYHVIRMDGLAPGQVLPFDTVRPKIAQALEKAAWVRASRAFVAGLVEAADIQGADPSRRVADA
jgi:peptidyl-prolyl cis-trans isomerase C